MADILNAIENFDPNGVGAAGSLYGLPFTPETASLVLIPVPWEVTVSYAAGTALGPEAILRASAQVDLFQKDIPDAWRVGLAMLPIPQEIAEKGGHLRTIAEAYIRALEAGTLSEDSPEARKTLDVVDKGCREMVDWVYNTAAHWRSKGKHIALVGGDHSTPLGLIQEIASHTDDFGVLHVDAHADLRVAYEGFEYSHASIMYNVLKLKQVSKMIQVGIRDFCESEFIMAKESNDRIETYYYQDISERRYNGEKWNDLCREIVEKCPPKVYVSVDIDGLDPKLCPNTGTPVPGGFEFEEVNHLLTVLAKSGREIIGFDLNEVSPGSEPDAIDTNDWDGNVGARMLYRMCNLMAVSQGFGK